MLDRLFLWVWEAEVGLSGQGTVVPCVMVTLGCQLGLIWDQLSYTTLGRSLREFLRKPERECGRLDKDRMEHGS